MEKIISKDNSKIKNYLKLKLKKFRDTNNLFLAYGVHQYEKAYENNLIVDIISSKIENNPTIYVDSKIIKLFNQTETIIEPIIVCKKIKEKEINNKYVLALDDIQDPGNLGTLLRSSNAFDFKDILLSENSVDVYNEKVIRSAKGSLFDLNIVRTNLINKLKELKNNGFILVCADNNLNDKKFDEKILNKNNKLILILGNEGNGISKDIKDICDYFITIETKNVESLNVSIAGSIIMHDWSKK